MIASELYRLINEVKQTRDFSLLPPYSSAIDDTEKTVAKIMQENKDAIFVADVGDNMYIVARAYAYAKADNPLLYSKNFAPLGCSVPKSIGAYYAEKKPVICFVGDQGLLFNIQELHYIAQHKLPVTIVVLNNEKSAMIVGSETRRGYPPLHTTKKSGYLAPDYQKLAAAFGTDIIEVKYE